MQDSPVRRRAPPAPPKQPAGPRADQIYTRLKRIGHGAFGEVFKGMHNVTRELVAIKVLNLESSDDEISDLQREIMLLTECATSEYVTKYHGSYLVGSNLWIIMDYCGAGSIRNLLKSGVISERHTTLIAREVAHALLFLHHNNIIHRDIKAANILMTDQGQIKLCDFGVAGQLAKGQTRRSFVGTPYWMAPEVVKGQPYDVKADIWSYGISLYEMLTGNPPYADQDPMRAMQLIPQSAPAQLDATQFAKGIREFVSFCLNDDPKSRPSAEDLIKHKFIKQVKRNPKELCELITRHRQWKALQQERKGKKAKNGDTESDIASDESGTEEFHASDEDGNNAVASKVGDAWLFDTVKSVKAINKKPIPTQPPQMTQTTSSSRPSRSGSSGHLRVPSNGTSEKVARGSRSPEALILPTVRTAPSNNNSTDSKTVINETTTAVENEPVRRRRPTVDGSALHPPPRPPAMIRRRSFSSEVEAEFRSHANSNEPQHRPRRSYTSAEAQRLHFMMQSLKTIQPISLSIPHLAADSARLKAEATNITKDILKTLDLLELGFKSLS